jgi:DNA-directed RNA polymerase specialized sigma subunit
MRLVPEKMDDLSLIEKVKDHGDSSCFQEIVNRHSGIYLQMVHSYAPRSIAIDNINDLLDSKESHIYDAVQNFDETRNIKFSTYLGNHTRWLCLNAANKKTHAPLDDNFDCEFESSESLEKTESDTLNKVFKFIEENEDSRVAKIFKMRYVSVAGKRKLVPWRKIAKEINLSIQGCINIHNSTLKKLKKKFHKSND